MLNKKICPICGKNFERQHNSQKYCSLKCAHIAKVQLSKNYPKSKHKRDTSKVHKAQCHICGKIFETTRGNKIYCSDECYIQSCRIRSRQKSKLKSEKRTHTCPVCGETFETTRGNKKFCSSECRVNYFLMKVKVRKHMAQCPVCGKSFETYGPRKYCSLDCRHEAIVEYGRRWKENCKLISSQRVAEVKPQIVTSLEDKVRQAEQCGLSYGKYTAQLRLGKTFEELRAAHLEEITEKGATS